MNKEEESLMLIDACKEGNIDQARKLLEEGANPDECVDYFDKLESEYYDDYPVLGIALLKGDTRMMKLLLEAGANPNIGIDFDYHDGVYQKPILWHACKEGRAEELKLLLEAGADPNSEYISNYGDKRVSCFFKVCKEGDVEQIRLFMEYGAKPAVLSESEVTEYDDYESYTETKMDSVIDIIKNRTLPKEFKDELIAYVSPIEDKARRRINYENKIGYIKGQIEENIETYKRTHRATKSAKKQISGVVVADEIAKNVVSDKEKRTITPRVGKELREKMMRERYSKKKEK